MKKRTITIALIVFAVALLFGIGYAAWTITQNTTGEAAGDFTAYSVSTEGLTVATTDDSVTFGKPATPGTAVWLSADSEVLTEDLTATFTVAWSGTIASGSTVTLNLTHTFYTGSGGGETAVSGTDLTNLQKLVLGPTFAVSGTGATISGSVLTLSDQYVANSTITVTVTYQWGPSLGGSEHANPYTFFNGKTISAAPIASEQYNSETTYGALAENALAALNAFVTTNNLHFKVVVTKTA